MGRQGSGQALVTSGMPSLKSNVQEVGTQDTLRPATDPQNQLDKGHKTYLFTEEDIYHAPVRDLLELINTLPGITFGVDVAGQLQMGVRGSIAGEATALVVDGVILNEGMYATFQTAGKFQLDQLRRVEVILSPDPVYYGGWACYAAIVIQTKAWTPFNGLRTAWTQGFHNPSNDSRINSSISVGKCGPEWSIAASGSVGRSLLSFQPYTDINGRSFQMSQNSSIVSRFGSVQLRYKKTSVTVVSDYYQLTTRDAYVHNTSQAYRAEFVNFDITARHSLDLTDRLKLQFLGGYKTQDPYRALDEVAPPDSVQYQKVWTRYSRVVAGSQLSYSVSPSFQLMASAQGAQEWGFDIDGLSDLPQGSLNTSFTCLTATGQARYQTVNNTVTASLRADKHSYAGNLLSPSISARRNIGIFFGKASYTSAARLPTVFNAVLATVGKLRAQRVNTLDLQAGIQTKSGLSATVGIFHSLTQNGVAYTADANSQESYRNVRPFGSQGLEVSIRQSKGKLRYQADYFYNGSLGLNCSRYEVAGTHINLGIPAHKASASISGPVVKDLSASLMGIMQGSRYGVSGPPPSAWADTTQKAPPSLRYTLYKANLTFNLFLHYKVGITEGLEISLGIVDILNQGTQYVQPYAGFHMPLPGPSREYIVRICYALER